LLGRSARRSRRRQLPLPRPQRVQRVTRRPRLQLAWPNQLLPQKVQYGSNKKFNDCSIVHEMALCHQSTDVMSLMTSVECGFDDEENLQEMPLHPKRNSRVQEGVPLTQKLLVQLQPPPRPNSSTKFGWSEWPRYPILTAQPTTQNLRRNLTTGCICR